MNTTLPPIDFSGFANLLSPEEITAAEAKLTISLIVRRGELCLPNGDDVYLVLATSDVKTFPWPGEFRLDDLRAALYDIRECGEIGSKVSKGSLPDGLTFDF